MTPEQARYFWSELQERGLLEACVAPLAAAGLAVALQGTDYTELSAAELTEAGTGLGFAVSPNDTASIFAMLEIAEVAASRDPNGFSDEPFEPFQIVFERGASGKIEAILSIAGVTFKPHVLQGTDIAFAWDYQRVARECLAAQKGEAIAGSDK